MKFTDIELEYLQHEKSKAKRAARIYFTQKKKEKRMACAKAKGYPFYPYYIKSERLIRECAREFVPEHTESRTTIRFNRDTNEYEEIFLGQVFYPAHFRKRILSSAFKEITPYLKQYCRTSARATYKRLAVRKERYAKYEFAPSARGSYKRVAEVDWLAW